MKGLIPEGKPERVRPFVLRAEEAVCLDARVDALHPLAVKHHPRTTPRLEPDTGGRWPARPGQPRPDIPSASWELVTGFDANGLKTASEFWLRGRKVGCATWYPSGFPCTAVGVRGVVGRGFRLEYHDGEPGSVSFAEPLVRGRVHGLTRQYNAAGRLVMVSPFVRGTGVDYWCDDEGRLAEERPIVRGRPSGCERWWNSDQTTVFRETQYRDGVLHGVSREWATRRLRRGFPQFFLYGQRVTKKRYLASAAGDPSVPRYRPEDDAPVRPVPQHFVALKQRAARLERFARRTSRGPAARSVADERIVFGEIIAERRYQVGAEWVVVQVGTPRRASWKSDFYCPLRIAGREPAMHLAFGVDSVQALESCLALLRQLLDRMRPPVFWEAGERSGDVGIAKRVFTGLGMEADQRAAKLVEDFARASVSELKASPNRRRRAKA